MKDGKRIDILQDFVAQYDREDMLAFFELAVLRLGGAPIAGLCKVSKPKTGSSELRYVSLTFMIDAPDDASRECVDEALARMEEQGLQPALPEVVGVVPVPSIDSGGETIVRQMDLLLDDVLVADRPFIEDRLIATIGNVTGFQVAGVTWWDNT